MHAPILKRVGGVLILIGLLDITAMIYCIVNDISYSSSFNIFAVIAGIFLLRGSLRGAAVVRWLAVFMLAGFTALLVAWPFLQPFSLTLMQLRLNPEYAAITIVYIAFPFGLLFWLAKELGRAPIQAAIIQTGRKPRDMRIPAAVGVGLVVVLGIFVTVLLGGESAMRAKSMAEKQMGPGYRFHVSSLSVAKNNRGTFVSGVVTAWNDNEIKSLPVHWEEP
jgi:hypothetical protein